MDFKSYNTLPLLTMTTNQFSITNKLKKINVARFYLAFFLDFAWFELKRRVSSLTGRTRRFNRRKNTIVGNMLVFISFSLPAFLQQTTFPVHVNVGSKERKCYFVKFFKERRSHVSIPVKNQVQEVY